MGLFDHEGITIERPSSITEWDKGQAVIDATTTFTARADVQPATSRDLLLVPELDREKQNMSIHTTFILKNKDVITINATGLKYQVQGIKDWTRYHYNHIKAVATLIDGQEGQ